MLSLCIRNLDEINFFRPKEKRAKMLLIGAAMWHTNLRTGNSVSRKFSNRGAAELLLPLYQLSLCMYS